MDLIECGICGAKINPETMETFIPRGSNAQSIETAQEKVEILQHDLDRALAEIKRMKEDKENGTGNETAANGKSFFDRLAGR